MPIAIKTEGLTGQLAPECPVFGTCGGCMYQNLPYEKELQIKEDQLKILFQSELGLDPGIFHSMVPSPRPYHYRHRLDLSMRRTRQGYLIGFQAADTTHVIPVESCAIAIEEVSQAILRVKDEAEKKIPADYRTANLVLRTGDDGRVVWGGIGRRSLDLAEKDYLWTEIEGRRIFYSLSTFFQANLSILPELIRTVRGLAGIDQNTLFWDLYAGVGLFGISFASEAAKVIMIEDNPDSVKLARYNAAFHGFSHVEIRGGRVETELTTVPLAEFPKQVAMIDPPRKGLSPQVAEGLAAAKHLERLLYLSCHPESLVRDLTLFTAAGWKITRIVPLDFFPKTRHLETLAVLEPCR